MVRLIIFTVVTLFLLAVTLMAQKEKRPWAWARFLAFELCLVIILLNVPQWFLRPFAPLQLLSWFLLAVSIFLALQGFMLLRSRGAPDGHFEKTTELVTSGTFRYIRHPMYSSLFFLTWGAFFKDVNTLTLVTALVSTAAALTTARIEEKDCLAKFGDEYRAYMDRTRMFVPFIL